jgi:hypothetical protein
LVQLCTLEPQTDFSIPERLSHIQVVCGGTLEGFLMASIYDAFAVIVPRSLLQHDHCVVTQRDDRVFTD